MTEEDVAFSCSEDRLSEEDEIKRKGLDCDGGYEYWLNEQLEMMGAPTEEELAEYEAEVEARKRTWIYRAITLRREIHDYIRYTIFATLMHRIKRKLKKPSDDDEWCEDIPF